jgi:hypothetical protein
VVEYPDPIGPTLVERRACNFALCPAAQTTAWQDERWTASGPIGCEDDPDAIGPDQRQSDWGEVWRDYTMPADPAWYSFESPGRISVSMGECGLNCQNISTGNGNNFEGPGSRDDVRRDWLSPVRVEARAALSDLPVETPSIVTITRTNEPPQ